jgi:hypothetical protein
LPVKCGKNGATACDKGKKPFPNIAHIQLPGCAFRQPRHQDFIPSRAVLCFNTVLVISVPAVITPLELLGALS